MNQDIAPPTGQIRGCVHVFPLRVFYEDTDLSGIVYHANYLRFCERARSDCLRLLGVDQRAAFEQGEGAYAVAEANIVWKRPAKLDDALIIETRVDTLRAASICLSQKVWRQDTLLAKVSVRVGFVGPDGRPRRQPEAWRRAFEEFAQLQPYQEELN